MLKSLYIKNFTLIDELDIELYPGFSVITGETGAGKSIILGAIALLLGQRADSKSIKQGADKCVIEAHFDLTRYDMGAFFSDNDIENDATDCIVRRELLASGKSRAFIVSSLCSSRCSRSWANASSTSIHNIRISCSTNRTSSWEWSTSLPTMPRSSVNTRRPTKNTIR